MENLSTEAEMVLAAITGDELKPLQKNNPCRNERNDRILELHKRGVKNVVIAEVTGLSNNRVSSLLQELLSKD